MKLIATADWHLTKTTPISRTDVDYYQTCLDKVQQIVDYAQQHEAVICVAGDIFDNLKVTPYMINKLYAILKDVYVFSVAGQHDMEYRNITESCAYKTLIDLEVIYHLTKKVDKYNFMGVSFNEEVPRNVKANVALVHKTITENDPPYFLKDATRASDIMKLLHDVKIIISGDYHIPFVKRKNGQVLINCGSLMRKGKDQIDYTPCVWLVDTETLQVDKLPLKIKPVEEVFSYAVRNETTPVQEIGLADMDKVIERLTKEELKPSFENILMALADEEGLSDEERVILQDVLETAKGGLV